ncbi:MAG: hypothetical protein WB998_03290 [Solirubrobacteraceae bacterium]
MRGLPFARAAMTVFAGVLLCLVVSAPAMGLDAPGWEVNSHSYPTSLQPGANASVVVDVFNIGGAESSAGAIITDTLPQGIEGVSANGWTCGTGSPSVCTREVEVGPGSVRSGEKGLVSGGLEEFPLEVHLGAGIPEGQVTNTVSVTGGGALNEASESNRFTVSAAHAGFGFAKADAWYSNADGTIDTQAGSHPFAFTFNFDLNTKADSKPEGEVRNVTANLPPGLVGNTTAVPRCTREQFDEENCPTGSQIGISSDGLSEGLPRLFLLADIPVYNLVPPPGHPAEFGFELDGNQVFLDASVRSDGDYGITEHVTNIPQREVVSSTVTIWGVPGDPSHDAQRACRVKGLTVPGRCRSTDGEVPFLTLPTSCTGPEQSSAFANEWADGKAIAEIDLASHDQTGKANGLTGCDHLGFGPSISAAPDTSDADTPAGLTVELKVPQEGLVATNGLAVSNIKDTTVTLPEGVVINPGQATGLGACQAAESAVGTREAPSCPSNSKVGTDEIETPLVKHSLKGDVYILQSNPPNLKLLVAASGEGVNLKLVGDVHLDEATGRLTTTFNETPELPFTTFRLSFSGGAQAALATPLRCGSYSSTSDFTPWSTPLVADVFPSSEFVISHGPGASACAGGTLPFSPQLTAGSTTDQAGGFTNFSLLLTREDGQQRIGSLQFKTPEGLLGMISKIPLCPEAQANAGTCSSASQIGHTVVEAGPGPYPLVVPQPGQPPAPIYLTGGYKGAPYGLSIVVPLVVGPFTLQTQVVRAKIEVDPLTAQLTVTTDPLPRIIDGIPADLRAINAVIDRPGFMFNPTGCEPSSFSGTATSTEGASVPIGSHFQMGSCRALTFKPDFKVSTSGKTSRKDGASLDAKIIYPTGELGANQASSQSNVKMVKVDLPKQLPSRLTTLQKACPSATFETNPAACPEDSRVGNATAITPVLPVQLTGPAYFVSYGGAKFPELVIVLQGYGVTVFLHGETFISKAGITSSTFRKVPDVPISSFELSLPEGPYSALAANGNLCIAKLKMPTAFTGQNGAVLKQTTPISVSGCAKHKAKKTKKKAAGKHRRGKGK